MPPKLLYIAITFPSRTLTFVAREIKALERLGAAIETVSMNTPAANSVSRDSKRFLDSTVFLDAVSPLRKLRGLWAASRMRPAAFWSALKLLFSIEVRWLSLDRLKLTYHWLEACYLSSLDDIGGVDRIHCHLVSGPTSIGMFLAELLGIPFSFTIHGSNLYLFPIALAAKLDRADFVVSVSDYHRRYVLEKYGSALAPKCLTIRAGLDFSEYPDVDRTRKAPGPVRVLSVGRLVELKGFDYLIRAFALLRDRRCEFSAIIVGDGPEERDLRGLIEEFDLSSRVNLAGGAHQEALPALYRDSDIFALACVADRRGGMDGIPVVLMEAMASRLPVVSTDFVGIPELIEHGVHGLLAVPGDAVALADALGRLIESPELRDELGRNAREKVVREFAVERSAERLFSLFTRRAQPS